MFSMFWTIFKNSLETESLNVILQSTYNLCLLELSDLKKYDTHGMYQFYDMWPKIARESYESNLETVDFKDITYIVFAGMGGSGTIGDIFSSILSKIN